MAAAAKKAKWPLKAGRNKLQPKKHPVAGERKCFGGDAKIADSESIYSNNGEKVKALIARLREKEGEID
jgi:hypothetical protein